MHKTYLRVAETQSMLHPEQQGLINLAQFRIVDEPVLGPGRRAIVWVQGCPRSCPNCITPHMQSFRVNRTWVAPETLAERLVEAHRALPVEGITFVGGEPFSQAGQLAEFVRIARRAADFSVVTYTGHTLERIRELKRPDWNQLLDVTDLLIDGEYIEALGADLLWRGSSNQELHFLTPRYGHLEPWALTAPGHSIRFAITPSQATGVSVVLIGVPRPGELTRLQDSLARRGVDLRWT